MEEVRNIALLMDNRGDSNWGSQATTSALVALLQKRFPGARIVGVPRAATRPTKLLRNWIDAKAPGLIDKPNSAIGFLLTRRLRAAWKAADLVVLNGEGTLHPQPQMARWLPALHVLNQWQNKPLWIVNSTVSFKGSNQEAMFRKVLPIADRICVRDPYSHAELGEAGIASELCADCAYLTEPSPDVGGLLTSLGVKVPYAVVTGSVESKTWPVEVQAEIIRHLSEQGFDVLFASSTRQDHVLHERLGGTLKMLTHETAGHRELMAIQGKARLLVTGRYHPTILAALMGTPFVALPSNTRKMEALMETLGTESFFLRADDKGGIMEGIDRAFASEEWFRSEVREKACAQKAAARRNVFQD